MFFKPYLTDDPKTTGSLGVGFTLEQGVHVTTKSSSQNSILFNNQPLDFPTLDSVRQKLTQDTLEISVQSTLPLGVGFGLSGACALATALSINELLNLQKSKNDLALVAHCAEVENKTGLGDVCGQLNGGFQIKTNERSPLESQPLPIELDEIYCDIYGELSTPLILTNKELIQLINTQAQRAFKNFEPKTFEQLCQVSKEFIQQTNLAPKQVQDALKQASLNSSMICLGNAIFSDSKQGLKNPKLFRISNKGAHII